MRVRKIAQIVVVLFFFGCFCQTCYNFGLWMREKYPVIAACVAQHE